MAFLFCCLPSLLFLLVAHASFSNSIYAALFLHFLLPLFPLPTSPSPTPLHLPLIPTKNQIFEFWTRFPMWISNPLPSALLACRKFWVKCYATSIVVGVLHIPLAFPTPVLYQLSLFLADVVVGGTDLDGSVACTTLRSDFCWIFSLFLVNFDVLDSSWILLHYSSYMVVISMIAGKSLAAESYV